MRRTKDTSKQCYLVLQEAGSQTEDAGLTASDLAETAISGMAPVIQDIGEGNWKRSPTWDTRRKAVPGRNA